MEFIPKSESQTIEDLKSIEFHGNNLVQLDFPSFYFDNETGDITYGQKDEVEDSRLYVVCHRLFINSESFNLDWWNNQKLVAWYPTVQYGYDKAYLIRLKTLID